GSFEDKGWIFSKILGIAICGFIEWVLVCGGALSFTTLSCILVVAVFALFSLFLFLGQNKKGIDTMPTGHWGLILWEEVIFFAVFLVWTYLAGFNAAAYGTEKFMDYGFMAVMNRSTVLPPVDLWYSQGSINYYYGGQYFAVFLSKLSGSKIELTYNLDRTFIAAFAFALPFSLVREMMARKLKRERGELYRGPILSVPILSGLTAGAAVTFSGNLHHMVYKVVPSILAFFKGEEAPGYWFPDATRYIGFNPDVPDKTIHEFPCYSFILGDLHAHVANIPFVLLLVGLMYAWILTMRRGEEEGAEGLLGPLTTERLKRSLLNPYLLLGGWLVGLFKFTNYWDFVIYFVVVAGTALFINLVELRGRAVSLLLVTLLQAIWVFALAFLAALPFEATFSRMVDGVALAQNHSLPHQLLILWGLPFFVGLLFMISQIKGAAKGMKALPKKSLGRLMFQMGTEELFSLLLYYCAFGLVLIPELVYVRDIYENGNARANTMFKLTYQAFMLFGIMMGYCIWHFLVCEKKIWTRVAGCISLVLVLSTLGYFGNCIQGWYGGIKSPEERPGLDCTTFLGGEFVADQGAILFLKNNVKGTPVCLEANGDSYTGYARVSSQTGLPTILGWYVHEWLWRSDTADLNEKVKDIENIYTSTDTELVETLLRFYNVKYIFIGDKEKEKFGERLTREVLDEFCTEFYVDPTFDTVVLQVNL
ncbi:MAG: hypothetical protein IIZ39_10615, partial [Blautia sp.]|nr:hypothetical protein [Blautia sp.]